MGDSLLALRPFLVCYKKATGLSMQILVPCLNHTVPQYCQLRARHNDHYNIIRAIHCSYGIAVC